MSETNTQIEYGRAETICEGEKIALVSVGAMTDTAVSVSENLCEKGYAPGLYNARFIKPLDMRLVTRLLSYDYVFTLEDGARAGGYGARLLEALVSTRKFKGHFHNFAFPDTFVEHGTRAELLKRYKLDADNIVSLICSELNTVPR